METAQRIGSPAADYSKTTDSENHIFCQMAAADCTEGGQVEPVLGGISILLLRFRVFLSKLQKILFIECYDNHSSAYPYNSV